jgi:general secretion pathway protein G
MSSCRPNRNRQARGFSLLALLAVFTIVAIVALVIVPHILETCATSREEIRAQNKADINLAVERWYFEKRAWPADDLSDIGADKTYFPSGLPSDPTSGAAYSLDSITHRAK